MQEVKRAVQMQVLVIGACVALAWLVELVDEVAFGGSLDRFGIRPRSVPGLWGILVAPLLHAGWMHLAANTGPFIVLAALVLLGRRLASFIAITLLIVVIGGLGVWLFGAANAIHVGASGLIFGYVGYLLARGYFQRSFWSIALALGVAVIYGGLLFGVLPGQRGISWEGHLFGFLGGIAAARLVR